MEEENHVHTTILGIGERWLVELPMEVIEIKKGGWGDLVTIELSTPEFARGISTLTIHVPGPMAKRIHVGDTMTVKVVNNGIFTPNETEGGQYP